MTSTPPHLLLVEDDENDVFFLRRALQSAGANVQLHVAADGRQALDYLHGRNGFEDRSLHPLPALVLLDLKVPYVSGLDVLRQIRADAKLRKLIVVVFTSSSLDSDVVQAYEIGANSFLVKPSRLEEQKEVASLIVRYWLQSNLPPPMKTVGDGAAPGR
jgi:CheY-like chemotaxis protein